MKFLKFWWKHSLGKILLGVVCIWASGYIHWFIYRLPYAGEDHLKALSGTIWIWFVVFIVYGYLDHVYNSYKKNNRNGA